MTSTEKYHDALAIESAVINQTSNCYREKCTANEERLRRDETDVDWSDDESLTDLELRTSLIDLLPRDESQIVYRLLHSPGDIFGHIDLLNGHKHKETCRCLTNALVRRED